MELFINPQPKQKQAFQKLFDQKTKYVLFGGAAGGGKTWLGCEWLLVQSLSNPGAKYFIARNELKAIMQSVMETFYKVCDWHGIDFHKIAKLNGQYNYIRFNNGSRIDLLDVAFSPMDPMYQRLGSLEFTGGWIEEAGEVDENAFEILKSRIGRHLSDDVKPKMLITCNPNKNWLYYNFYLPWKNDELDDDKAFIPATYSDNEYTQNVYGEQLASLKDKVSRQRLMYGNWEYDDDGTSLLTFDEITDLFRNKENVDDPKRYMTVDPAFLGKDEAVIMIWEGFHVVKIFTFPKTDHQTLMAFIDSYASSFDIPRRNIVADAVGEGAYLPSMLKGIRAFLGGSRPLKNNDARYKELEQPFFANLRTQCIYEMAHKISMGDVYVPSDDVSMKEKLVQELQQWKIDDLDTEKRLKIVSKDLIKRLIGRSTDYSDCLSMRMFFELVPESPGMTSADAIRQEREIGRSGFSRFGV